MSRASARRRQSSRGDAETDRIKAPAFFQGFNLENLIKNKAAPDVERYIYCESLYPTKYGGNSLFGIINGNWKYIQTNKQMETNVPGVFAAGDICGPPWQMAKAVGEGCVAGLGAASFAKKKAAD